MSNPNYPPEIQAEAALINFTVTEVGLSDQLLALVVSKERPDLARTKINLIKEQNEFKITLRDLETNLLDRLTNAKGNLLENIELIENLEESKRLSVEIGEKVAIAKVTEKDITDASEMYRPSAVRGALIFFLMNELYKMSSFYMYSLESYVNVINIAIDSTKLEAPEAAAIDATNPSQVMKAETTTLGDSTVKNTPRIEKQDTEKKTLENESSVIKEKSTTKNESSADNVDGDMEASDVKVDEPAPDKDIAKEELENVKILTPRSLKKRVKDITDSITYTAFQSVRRGLFEDHKLIFATLLTFRILIEQKILTQAEVDHLIVSKQLPQKIMFPESESLRSYITEQMYRECKSLESMSSAFDGLTDSLLKDNLQWKKWMQEEKAEEVELPKDYKEMKLFHKLMLIKILRPDRVSYTLKLFVIEKMGRKFIDQPPFDIFRAFKETSNLIPIFFVLFPGVDPTPDVERIGKSLDITAANGKFLNISMGQGQEDKAIEELKKACKEGTWIFLQNVHLMQNWLKTFEQKLEEFSTGSHPNFRCFISSEPPPKLLPTMNIIPEAILQRCIKVSNESPSDLMSNMLRAYSKFSDERINNAP